MAPPRTTRGTTHPGEPARDPPGDTGAPRSAVAPRDLVAALTEGATAIVGLIPNRELAQQLASAVVRAGGPPPLPAVGGLATQQRIDDYVAAVRGFAAVGSALDLPVSALARWAFWIANNELAAIGVPRLDTVLGSAGTAAHFSPRDWSMTLDLGHFARDGAGPATVGSLSADALAEIAGTVYHEARHAEQAFRQARLLVGRHHDELHPPVEPPGPDDPLELLVARARLAAGQRRLVVLQLALDVGVPESVIEQAAAQPLLEAGGDLQTRVLGAVALGLPALTIGDLLRPGHAIDTVVAGAQQGAALHDAQVREAATWYAQDALGDLVYDRSGLIRSTLDALAAEVPKARTPVGMDLDVVRDAREPMREIVAAIDAEIDHLGWQPHEVVMRGLLFDLRATIMEIGAAIVELAALQRDPDAPDRATLIDLQVDQVATLVALVDLQLRSSLYEALFTEADAYAQGRRVEEAWRRDDAP